LNHAVRVVKWLKRLLGGSDAPESSIPVLVDDRRTRATASSQRCGVVVVDPEAPTAKAPTQDVQWRTVQLPQGARRMPTSQTRATPVRGKRVPPPSILGNPWANASVEDSRAKGYEKPSDDY
jgi:hypothetical protein